MSLTVLNNVITLSIQIPYLVVIAVIIAVLMLYAKKK
jgi:hypothetical protein